MKKCIVIPDSFKGTLTATEYCDIARAEILRQFCDCEIVTIPIADGGEGTVDCFLNIDGFVRKEIIGQNAFKESINTFYAKKDDKAVIEMAAYAGLPQAEGRQDIKNVDTFGVGMGIKKAIEDKARVIYVGLGGSCTNDGGVGMAAALGAIFYDKNGKEFYPTPITLRDIGSICLDKLRENIRGCDIIGMCDVENPLSGKNGAAYIFAPQKGADQETVKLLDENLQEYGKLLDEISSKSISTMNGSGAAGGMGGGIVSLLNGKLISGIDAVLDIVAFDDILQGTDVIFTGEGRIDSQSIDGKVIAGIARRAKAKNIAVVAVVGSIGDGAKKGYDIGVSAIFSINTKAEDFSVSRYKTKENLAATFENILRLYKTIV